MAQREIDVHINQTDEWIPNPSTQPTTSPTTLESILALEAIPYWRQDSDHYRPGTERDAEVVTALMAIPQELRHRWLIAMAPVACKLVRFREIVAGMENDGRLRE